MRLIQTLPAQLIQFAYLQILDLLSTVAFMAHGVGEANPMVRWSMSLAPHPLGGLLAVKLAAVGLAIYALRLGRYQLLSRMNIFFAALIAWNLLCLILRGAAV